jgi:hypothetical protein
MNTQKKLFLLPYRFQTVGCILAGTGLVMWIIPFIAGFESKTAIHWALYGTLVISVGLFLIGFSREKREDEFTLHLRTSSALTAMLVIFGLKILLTFVTSYLLWKEVISKDGMVKDMVDEVTDLSMVFFLYLIIYKIRLARFNKECKELND